MSNVSRKRRLDDGITSSQSTIQQPQEARPHSGTVLFIDDVIAQMRLLESYLARLGRDVFENIVTALKEAEIIVQRDKFRSYSGVVVYIDDFIAQMRILDGYLSPVGLDIFENILTTLEKAEFIVQRKQMQYDDNDSDDDADVRRLVDQYVEKRRLRRLAKRTLTGNQSLNRSLIVGGTVDGEAGSLKLPEEHSDNYLEVPVSKGVEGIQPIFLIHSNYDPLEVVTQSCDSSPVVGEIVPEPETVTDLLENHGSLLLSADLTVPAVILSYPDNEAKAEKSVGPESDRNGTVDEPQTEQSDSHSVAVASVSGSVNDEIEFDSDDLAGATSSLESSPYSTGKQDANCEKSLVDLEQPENRGSPFANVGSRDPAAIVSKSDREAELEKDNQTDQRMYEPVCDRGGSAYEPTTDQSGVHMLANEFGLEDGEIGTDDTLDGEERSLDFELADIHENPFPDLDSGDSSAIFSNHAKNTIPEKDIQTNLECDQDGVYRDLKTEQVFDDDWLSRPYDSDLSDGDFNNERDQSAVDDSDGAEYVVDRATVSKHDKQTNPEKDIQTFEEIERLNRLSHGELISNIIHSKKGLNCPAFIALKAKEEGRLWSVVVESNGMVQFAVAKLTVLDAAHQPQYVNIFLTSMAPQMTPDQPLHLGDQLISLINILLHGYDVSESRFDFKLLDFDDRHNSLLFERCFNSSSEKIPIKYLDMGKNKDLKVLAPLLQYVCPKYLHIGFPSLYLLETGELDELRLNLDTEDCVDSVMEQCRARNIYLSAKPIWTDDSIKKVLTEHVCNVNSKNRKIHGNCSKGDRLQLRNRTQWLYLSKEWRYSCLKVSPIPNVWIVHFEIPKANALDPSYYINLKDFKTIKSEISTE